MYSVANFLKTTKCSLNGHFLSGFLIKAESMTLNHSSVKAFLRASMFWEGGALEEIDALGLVHLFDLSVFELYPLK